MVKSATLRLAVITAAMFCVFALAFSSCGKGKHSTGTVALPSSTDGESAATAPSLSLDDALGELDELACPEGVDAALWEQLKSAFTDALTARCSGKGVSIPPSGVPNRVNDLSVADNGDGTYTLSWHYRNLGDYDQNGMVAIADITPIAQHFGETYDPVTEPNCIQAVIDGSGNGKVDIADVTPIAQCFNVDCAGYRIEGADSEDGPFNLVQEVAQNAGTGDGRLEYAEIIQSPAALWHRVVTYDAEGNAGEPSNAVLRPSNEPIIYAVTPAEGYQHEEYTFTATVTGVEPLTYAWDFGGGADPNMSSDISPTVSLAGADEYEATLTVTNAYGPTTFPFTLTVNERDTWAHTWGGPESEQAVDVAVDSKGNIYVLGYTESFGAGSSDVLVVKYAPDGVLQWARTWGGEITDHPVGIAILSDGDIVAGGYTKNYGAGMDDIFILRYDPDGSLLMQKTWGTPDYERVADMAVDEEGNIYFAGNWLVYGGTSDVLAAKFNSGGDCLWAQTWGNSGLTDDGRVIAVTSQRCYIAVRPSVEAADYDVGVLAFDADGTLRWALGWGGEGTEAANCVAVAPSNHLLVGGITRSFGDEAGDAFIITADDAGQILSEAIWQRADRDSFGDIVCSSRGYAYLVGDTKEPTIAYSRGMVVQWDYDGSFSNAIAFVEPSNNLLTGVEDSTGNLVLAGVSSVETATWEPITAITSQPDAHAEWLSVITAVLEGTSGTPDGIISAPLGDSGGGADMLTVKNPSV